MELQEAAKSRIRARLAYLLDQGERLVIDGDVHPTDAATLPPEIARKIAVDPNYYHGKPLLIDSLIGQMDQAGVDMALCWQNPAILAYADDPDENYRLLFEANNTIAKFALLHPTRVIPGGWTDPKALGLDNAIKLARRCVEELGMPIVKMNPAQNAYPIDDPMVLKVVDEIVRCGAIPAFHFGSDTSYTPPSGLRTVAERHPNHPVIGVHMGGGGGHFVEAEPVYQGARELGMDCPNVFFVLSAIRDTHIESALITYAHAGRPWSQNLAVGSDAPYCNLIWTFGAFRALFEALNHNRNYGDPRLVEKPDLFDSVMVSSFMGSNLARLVAEADERILSRSSEDGGLP